MICCRESETVISLVCPARLAHKALKVYKARLAHKAHKVKLARSAHKAREVHRV
jgi:hypothetical protein